MQKCRFLKSRRAGREIMQRLVRSRCEASTSSLYSNVICLTQIGRCTRCWIWRQLSDPTGLRGLSCSSWWKCVQTTGLSPVRHVSQGFSFICKHCAVEKKNVLILVEWLHSEMGLAPSVLWQQKSSFTVIKYGHVLLVFFVSTSGTEKKGNSRGRTLGDRLKGASSSSLISLLVHQIANLSYAHWHQSNPTRAGQRWARSHDLHSTKNKKK